ncbi:hypothetical protein GCM10009682_55650 [Luedemannella flava]|uniref:Uncharacterized protein n=1 Tax=Luedemannella flava TaxID=349316 RepID=A0ABN2ML14_9ACTN
MADPDSTLDTALADVVRAAEAHLAAVRAAAGRPDDDAVWQAYVALNNAARAYDEALNGAHGEVTPWDLEEIAPDGPVGRFTGAEEEKKEPADDPYDGVLSVRQRRDYRVPSVAGLLRVADEARRSLPRGAGEPDEPITTVAEAVLELMRAGDGSLGMLDLPELAPLDGAVLVAEVLRPLDLDNDGADETFRVDPEDRVLGRLDERMCADVDDDGRLSLGD